MPSISIPEPFRPALERIGAMPEPEFERLYKALTEAPPNLNLEVVVENTRASLGGESPEVREIIQAITSLSAAFLGGGLPLDEFVSDVARSVVRRRLGSPAKKIDPEEFKKRLVALLSIDSVRQAARANDVQHEYENLFSSARILSDIRPIFDEGGQNPHGAVIVHNLKLTFFRAGHYSELFVGMDNADLKVLQRAIERAVIKTDALERLIQNTDLKYFESK